MKSYDHFSSDMSIFTIGFFEKWLYLDKKSQKVKSGSTNVAKLDVRKLFAQKILKFDRKIFFTIFGADVEGVSGGELIGDIRSSSGTSKKYNFTHIFLTFQINSFFNYVALIAADIRKKEIL